MTLPSRAISLTMKSVYLVFNVRKWRRETTSTKLEDDWQHFLLASVERRAERQRHAPPAVIASPQADGAETPPNTLQ
jgi:hypothetical protein